MYGCWWFLQVMNLSAYRRVSGNVNIQAVLCWLVFVLFGLNKHWYMITCLVLNVKLYLVIYCTTDTYFIAIVHFFNRIDLIVHKTLPLLWVLMNEILKQMKLTIFSNLLQVVIDPVKWTETDQEHYLHARIYSLSWRVGKSSCYQ